MLTADRTIHCWGSDQLQGRLGMGSGIGLSSVPAPATQFNFGSANVQLVAFAYNTYVNIELVSPLFLA
jgi:hypothetical protein